MSCLQLVVLQMLAADRAVCNRTGCTCRVMPVLLANTLGSPPLRQSVDCGLLRSLVPAQA